MELLIPRKKGETEYGNRLGTKNICVVGANGSGKTRFGVSLARLNKNSVSITAQKNLQIPETQTIKDLEFSRTNLGNGLFQQKNNSFVAANGLTSTTTSYDYDRLLDFLFSEEASVAIKYKQQGGGVAPVTALDCVKRIWERVLPHKELISENLRLEISGYSSREGSDGERLIIYIIGKIVTAPEGSLIVIDEPENNLHKSILNSLYNELESVRQDCVFTYLTHDLDFAISRNECDKIWMRDYCTENRVKYDYEILVDESPIQEHLYLEVLGSRNDILFIEGDESSLDYRLYQEVYPEYTVKPVGSCQTVIDNVTSFNNQAEFHRLKAFGLIDRDRRTSEDVQKLNMKDVWVLDVAEVESLFLLENVVVAIQNHLSLDGDIFAEIETKVFSYFSIKMDDQIQLHLKEELSKIYRSLQNMEISDIDVYVKSINQSFSDVDVKAKHKAIKEHFENIVEDKDYSSLLAVFNEKNKRSIIAYSEAHKSLGFAKPNDYIDTVIRLCMSKQTVASVIQEAVKANVSQ